VKKFALVVSKIIIGLLYKLKISGTDKIKENEAYLLCANHTSLLDMFFIQVKFKRWVYWMAKTELFKNPIIARLLTELGAFPVSRGKPDIAALKTAIKALREGKICGVFPEGTRKNRNNGKILSPKSGAAFLAYKADVKILPVYISPDHRPFGKVHVVVGEPFKIIKGISEDNNNINLKESSQYIMDRIYALKEKNA